MRIIIDKFTDPDQCRAGFALRMCIIDRWGERDDPTDQSAMRATVKAGRGPRAAFAIGPVHTATGEPDASGKRHLKMPINEI